MRKSYTKGSRTLMVLTLLVFGFAYLAWDNAITNLRDERELYQEGHYLDGSSGYSIANVLGIEELALEDETLAKDEKFYMLETEHTFVILKSNRENLKKIIGDRLKEDQTIKKFAKDEIYARVKVVPEKTYKRRGTRINITPELQEKFSKASDSSILVILRIDSLSRNYSDVNVRIAKLKERPFYTNIYIVPPGDWDYLFDIGVALFVTLIAGLMLFTIVKQIRLAKQNYERLFMVYPEIAQNMNRLIEEATYIDEKLKVLVYKDAIIVYKGVFEFEKFSHVKKVIFDKLTSKGRVIGYTIAIVRNEQATRYNRKIGLGKKDRQRIRQFGSYLRKSHAIPVSYYF